MDNKIPPHLNPKELHLDPEVAAWFSKWYGKTKYVWWVLIPIVVFKCVKAFIEVELYLLNMASESWDEGIIMGQKYFERKALAEKMEKEAQMDEENKKNEEEDRKVE
ncbi:uncharacterized protein LOC129001886 [Macrosteles quadrilineatus]|uniref:uncharacterized protein LOC129001886 n=1 Tax=Macrosteles quadrilineatus TaxID=74068 RepID=UPI0023E163E0|nr:uncharacterized protein LOC129001886 [Macrosteles quadrilineatus]